MGGLGRTRLIGIFLIGLAGCAELAVIDGTLVFTSADTGCIGKVATPAAGLEPVADDRLVEIAYGAPGQGKLCTGQAFMVSAPLTVYRVWDSGRPYSEYGNWWTFAAPAAGLEQYRELEAICPEWSAPDRLSVCQIKVGTRIAVGPGQSVQCADGSNYPPAAANQIYIPNDAAKGKMYLEHCAPAVPWPQ
ncbi:hypothetical protein PL263_08915 [Methylomonas sp. EFPC3]|uniref:hypothetical protein n=1 Tax=Methylomonas sp. EFPC3 TaxID=3021710 RepID=UPI0024163FDE|nr:hypothetical protein [Methylomonas sp. EFPC3]WFP52133.1 hypothetical protein PL263_08915 [Methylomonas sp. EFPC3]